jgi:hypothetical protein
MGAGRSFVPRLAPRARCGGTGCNKMLWGPVFRVPGTSRGNCATSTDPHTAADHTASAAARQRRCSDLHCTFKPIVDHRSLRPAESEVTHDPMIPRAADLTRHGAAPGWACARENMGERRTEHGDERPRPTASHD